MLDIALEQGGARLRTLADLNEFKAQRGRILAVPDAEGGLEQVLFGLGEGAPDPMSARGLPEKLPLCDYRSATVPEAFDRQLAALGWRLGAYAYGR